MRNLSEGRQKRKPVATAFASASHGGARLPCTARQRGLDFFVFTQFRTQDRFALLLELL
jgi:hypothetical protein